MYFYGIQFIHLFIVVVLTLNLCESHYTIIAPGTISSNRKFSVCVTLHNVHGPATIRVGIESKYYLNMSQQVTLRSFESKLLEFIPSKLSYHSRYKLVAEGISGIFFRNSTELKVKDVGGPMVYVEPDRGIYKPNDLLQFRVVILDEHMIPMKIVEPIKVEILDPAAFRIKQYKDIQLIKGVFAGKFQISKEPPLGKWSIVVRISGKYHLEKKTYFNIGRYVLPKFSAHIETEQVFVKEDRFIKINVYGKYTYDKYVEGNVELEIFTNYAGTPLLKQTGDIVDFKAKFQVDIIATGMDFDEIIVRAKLVEKHTNLIEYTTAKIMLKEQRFSITIPDNDIELRYNQYFKIKALVQFWNGTKVNDPLAPVTLECGKTNYQSNLDENGMVSFIYYNDPAEECTVIYKNSSIKLPSIYTDHFEAGIKEQCLLKMKTIRPHLGAIIEIELTSDDKLSYFVYTVSSHGNIIHIEHVKLNSPRKSYTIRILPTVKMIPKSFLYVHYIQNEILYYCEMDIILPREFQNKISITAPTNVQPGNQVTINVEAEPNSHVSILAVDLKVILHNADTSLKKIDIISDLANSMSYANTGAILSPGLNSGLVTLTDVNYVVKFYPETSLHETVNSQYVTTPRSEFPETWIFKDLEINQKTTSFTLNIPDTITTWIISAFSINENTGFGILDEPFQITVFKQLFISTHLPYSIKRGEIINIPVTIFNYFSIDLRTEIVMENINRDYSFVDDKNNVVGQANVTKSISVLANSGKSVDFRIRPLKVGVIDIRLIAQNPLKLVLDGVLHKLKVEPEGIVKQYNSDVFLTLRDGQAYASSFKAGIPKDFVAGSEYLLLSIGGDILVPSLENLEDLVLMPTGCGEQNMINLAPNILVLDYLRAINKTLNNRALVAKAKKYIENGYQQQLQFRHIEGGYSVFGPKLNNLVSNWLTAYVIRFFIKSLEYSFIDRRIIESGLEYLKSQQLESGEFPHTGYLFYPAHQNRYGFTAFVLLTFLETKKYSKTYSKVINKGIRFLASNVNAVNDTYSLAIMATAFQMSKDNNAMKILTKLLTMAKEGNNLKWWTGHRKDHSNDIEITSYILMALMKTPGEYLSIYKWLLQQRNQHGGFKSTHNTVVGLQALVTFARQTSRVHSTQLTVLYTAKNQKGDNLMNGTIGIDPDNMLILQKHELPRSTRTVYYELSGHGNIFMQFSYNYYVSTSVQIIRSSVKDVHEVSLIRTEKEKLQQKTFIITPTAKLNNPTNTADLEICFEYQPTGYLENTISNMVIMQIYLPSGFIASTHNLKRLQKSHELINRVESENSDSLINLYLDNLTPKTGECFEIEVDKMNDVSELKPSHIVMYDYYNNEQRCNVSYEIQL